MPQKFCDEIIYNFTDENDSILDPFCGLGTTGISCAKMNRKFTGIELDEEYFNIAQQRVQNEYNKYKNKLF